jgi:hypothetical protein
MEYENVCVICNLKCLCNLPYEMERDYNTCSKSIDSHTYLRIFSGELGLFGLTVDGQRMRSAIALTECELLKLNYHSLKILLLSQIDLRSAFRKRGEWPIVRMGCMRMLRGCVGSTLT